MIGAVHGGSRSAPSPRSQWSTLPSSCFHPSNWWWTYSFQSSRQATWGSAWFYVLRMAGLPVHGTSGAQIATWWARVALVGGLTWVVVRTVRFDLDPFAAAGAAVAICILANKVYSPTYDVWLVVFFVMLPLSRRLWLDVLRRRPRRVHVVYGYFDGPLHIDVVRAVLPVLVVLRTAVLLTIVMRATAARAVPRARARARRARRDHDEWTVSSFRISDWGIGARPSATRRTFISLISVRCTRAMVRARLRTRGVLAVLGRVLRHRDAARVVTDHEVGEQVVGFEARRLVELARARPWWACPACRPAAPGGPSTPSPPNRRRRRRRHRRG